MMTGMVPKDTTQQSVAICKGLISERTRRLLGIPLICLSLFSGTTAADAKIFTGTVIDANNGEPLIGASVQVEGTTFGVVTDFDGKYMIDAPLGVYFIIRYVSYTEARVQAEDNLIISLQEDSETLGEVQVVAQQRRDVEATILQASKNSLSIQTGVSAQQIKRTQDKDASEVMRRVPGVSIIDGKFVMVRGLSQRYNNVWINGSAVPSSEADSRAFSFDIIPSAQLDNIMIVKSPSPEYPADFSGGFILVNTKTIPEVNNFSISIGGNVNDATHFRQFLSASSSKTDWLGFDGGLRSLPHGINTPLSQLGSGVNLQGNGFNNDWRLRTRKPIADLSFNTSLTRYWKISGGDKLGMLATFNYGNDWRTYRNMENSLYGAYDVDHDAPNYLRHSIDNQYTNSVRSGAMLNFIWMQADGDNTVEFKNIFNQLGKSRYTDRIGVNAQSDQERSAEYYYSSRTTYNGQFSGKHKVDENNLRWNAGYSYANRNFPDRKRYIQTDAIERDSFALVNGNDINREFTYLNEHIASASFDYDRDVPIGPLTTTVKAGAYGEYRTRDYRTRNFIYSWNPVENNLPTDFRTMDMTELLSNEAYFGEDGLYMIEDVKWRNNYKGNNTLVAAYAAWNIPWGKFNVYAGLRYEFNRMELISNTRDYEESPTSNYYTYNDLFPSVNFTYKITEEHQLRAAYGKSVNRPEFREVSSSVFYDFDLASNVQGNANLTSCYIHNADVRYEFYPSKTEQITVALFYKHFLHPIEWTYTVAGGTDLVYSYRNAKSADSYGIEVDIKKSFDFIGVPDLSILFNGSLIKSVVQFEAGDREQARPMQGQSPYLINTGLFYQNQKIGLSASVMYNRIGKRLIGVGRNMGYDDNIRIPDSYEMPRNALDFTIAQKFAEHFEIRLSLKDIIGEPILYQQEEKGIQLNDGTTKDVVEVNRSYLPGRNFSLSFTYTL